MSVNRAPGYVFCYALHYLDNVPRESSRPVLFDWHRMR